MQVTSAAKSDIGMRRAVNQDSILCDSENKVFIVADGLGGHSGGEVASQLAVKSLCEQLIHPQMNGHAYKEYLKESIDIAGKSIFEFAVKNPALHGMGTTLTAACIEGGLLHVAQIGDSRAYLLRPPYIWQITEDHSLVQEQVRAGLLTAEQALHHQYKNVITRSLGHEPMVALDLFIRPVEKGDIYLLCSDGLTNHLSDSDILSVVEKHPLVWDAVVGELIDIANSRGGEDNCSVVIFSINEV